MDALNALSVDLEEYFQVSNFDGVIPRDSWDGLDSRVGDATRRLLDLFERTGSRSTFFVLGWVAERQPALVREVADRGHEIACHGYGHELVYEIGPERFREDLTRARQAIEDAVGAPVRGYRAPSYSITHRSLWALETLAELGFEYDSSIFPIRHHRYGIPEFERVPVRVRLPSGARITEFPLSTLRMFGGNFPIAGGAYLRFLPGLLFRMGFGQLIRAGQPTVLYLHPWEIDAGQPVQDVSRKVRINHYYNLARMESKLAALVERHPFTSLHAVLEGLEAAGRLPERPLEAMVGGLGEAEIHQSAA